MILIRKNVQKKYLLNNLLMKGGLSFKKKNEILYLYSPCNTTYVEDLKIWVLDIFTNS